MGSARTWQRRLLHVFLAASSLAASASAAHVKLLGTSSSLYTAAAVQALTDLKASLGAGPWSSSWVATSPCSSWAHTTCDSSGNLLALNISGLGLTGTIPNSFYKITTLEVLDVSNNKLYGGVSRSLAVLNPNLYWLDLSSNFFSGPYPDYWPSSSLFVDPTTFNLQKSAAGPEIYINVSHTFLTGYSTVFATVGMPYPYFCLGTNLLGSFDQSCVQNLASAGASGIVLGACPIPGDGSVHRPSTECLQFCGAGNSNNTSLLESFTTCNSIPGQYCVPGFAASSGKPTCQELAPTPIAPPALQFSTSPNVNSADAATLTALFTALGSPPALNVLTGTGLTCSKISTVAQCNANGNIAALTFGRLSLQTDISNFGGIVNLPALQKLDLSNNMLFGNWSNTFNLQLQLKSLVYLDVSNNNLWGPLPSNFNSYPILVNVAGNYFSGSPTVQYQFAPADASTGTLEPGLPAIYCPAIASSPGSLNLTNNCLTLTVNPACPLQPAQRSALDCLAMCGITTVTDKSGRLPAGPCADGTSGSCKKTGGAFSCQKGPSPPSSAGQPPVAYNQLLYFAQAYIAWGTPPSVFSTWQSNLPCGTPAAPSSGWKGVTCDDDRNVISLDLGGKGLVGPFPQPTVFQEPFWNLLEVVGTVRYMDLSNNKLYGILDPVKLKYVNRLDHLDLSNNFLTGSLPQFLAGQFQYLNMSNNYFTGRPSLVGIDNASPICSSSTPVIDISKNCFDLAPTNSCPAVTGRPSQLCQAYCLGASSKKPACKKRNTVCKLLTVRKRKKVITRAGCASA